MTVRKAPRPGLAELREADERIAVLTQQRDAAHEDLAQVRALVDAVRATFGDGPPAPLLAMAEGAALERQHLHKRVADLQSRLATVHAARRNGDLPDGSPRVDATLRICLRGLRHGSNPQDVQLAALVIATLLDLDFDTPELP